MKILLHIIIIILLTILTQIGGIIYLLSILIINRKVDNHRLKRTGLFTLFYLAFTFIIIPIVAPIFGREKIKETDLIAANTIFTKLMNRNYVRPKLNKALEKISVALNKNHHGIKLIYLDANFPFINKFPLLPHLSHNDGKKIDVSLIYQNENGVMINQKPSISGYGVFENPGKSEYDQVRACKTKGNWQYDFPKYLTFGRINKVIKFSEPGTRDLMLVIAKQPEIGKIFIEPHLKRRLNLKNEKIRFHGCQAVRHDDHIHFQLK